LLRAAAVLKKQAPRLAGCLTGPMEFHLRPDHSPSATLIEAEDELLRKVGLSKAKIKALKNIARKTLDGTVPSSEEIVSLSNEEIIKRLTSVYGVGLWTVEMMRIFNLGRRDVFPIGDYALRKSMSEVLGLKEVPRPKQAEALGDLWRPYRTVATLYLWNTLNP
jgi:DNA-3-methyladenine glycosylase II